MFMNRWYGGGILVKLEKTHLKEGLVALEKAYKRAIPQAVYQYHFLDELNARQYEQEQRWQYIISIATAFSITICCLGLFGLAHLATYQRVKEIGIRKVLGATITQVVTLFSASFLKLVIVAIFIASPFAWLIMNHWLQDFAYRVNIGPGIFISAGVISLSIALLAVSFQAVKAAMTNPIISLRME
jgi:putative ABC transport system permease protein